MACGAAPLAEESAPAVVNPGDYPGMDDIAAAQSTLLHAGACTGGSANGSTSIVVSLNNNETAYLTLSPSDRMVVVNGLASENCKVALAPTGNGFPAGRTITINFGTTPVAANDSRTVILDYVNGLWGQSAAGTAGVVNINLGTASGVNNTVKIRGSAQADSFYFGKGAAALTATRIAGTGYLFNINGGSASPLDVIPDVMMSNIQNLIVSTGPGADKIVADGTMGTTAPYLWPVQMFGGADGDILTGGAGADILSGDLGGDTMTGAAGANVYAMGTVAQGGAGAGLFDTITVTNGGVDTVDYSQRTGDVSVTLATAPTSNNGEAGESAVIPDTVSVVLGGYGNDTFTAAGSSLNHTFKGGLGNDSLTGGNGLDVLIGGTGDALTGDGNDTFAGSRAVVDYSARTSPLSLMLDSAGAATSGDIAGTTVSIQNTTAADTGATISAPTAGIATVTGLADMDTTDSVGHYLVLSGTTGGLDDGTFRITACTSATECTIDVSGDTDFDADTDDGFSFAEEAHVRTAQATTVSNGTITAGSSTVTGLTNMTAGSVGHYLVITSSSNSGADDSGPRGYKILTLVNSTTVTVDASSNTNWANDAGPFSWSEQINVSEADVIKVGTVLGSSTAANAFTAVDGGTHHMTGGSASDTFIGGTGADTMYGMGGADTLYGGAGEDTLFGGDGTDTLFGGDGSDVVAGDQLADAFECDGNNAPGVAGTAPGNADFAVDFLTGTDTPAVKPASCDF